MRYIHETSHVDIIHGLGKRNTNLACLILELEQVSKGLHIPSAGAYSKINKAIIYQVLSLCKNKASSI